MARSTESPVGGVRGSGGLRGALAFLTVVPVGVAGAPHPTCTRWFPLVGAFVGVGVAGVLLAGAAVFPTLPPLVPAVLALALWSLLPGGLHEDAWCDVADAALPPVSRERRVQILQDPRVGAHGATALVLVLFLRGALLAAAGGWSVSGTGFDLHAALPMLAAVALAPVVGRAVMVFSLAWARPLRPHGLAADFAAGARPLGAAAVLALLFGAALLLADLPPWVAVGLLAAGLLAGFAMVRFLEGRLGGLSGDGHGAAGYAAETAALLAGVTLLHGVALPWGTPGVGG